MAAREAHRGPRAASKKSEALLGMAYAPVEWMILCPIRHMYEEIRRRTAPLRAETEGFMRAQYIEQGAMALPGDGLLVATPQGPAASDPIFLGLARRILVLGFAGSLDPDIPIGEIVEATASVGPMGGGAATAPLGGFRTGCCGWSPSLLGPAAEKAVSDARENGANIIDMETAYCFEGARDSGADCSALLVVTDIPGHVDFFEITLRNKIKIREAEDALLRFLAPPPGGRE